MRILTVSMIAILAAGGASAATVLIDDFNEDQFAADAPAFGIPNSSSTAAAVPGGTRLITAANDDGTQLGTQVAISGGSLSFSNTSGTSGTGTLEYNDLDSFDLTFGGNGTGFVYDLERTDFDLLFSVTATDEDGNSSSFSATFPGFSSEVFVGSFSEFAGSADLTNLDSLVFTAGGNGVLDLDATINSIGVNVVPLPASALLLGGALLGAGAFARKRKSA